MRIRLYFDEDSARHSLARELRFRGADVVTAIETGMAHKTDEEQLEWAAANSRVVYSFNRGDFYGLHTVWLEAGCSNRRASPVRNGWGRIKNIFTASPRFPFQHFKLLLC